MLANSRLGSDVHCAKGGADRTLRKQWPDIRSKDGRCLLMLTGSKGVTNSFCS